MINHTVDQTQWLKMRDDAKAGKPNTAIRFNNSALCKKRHDNTLLVIRDVERRGLLKNSTPHQYTHEQNGQQYKF